MLLFSYISRVNSVGKENVNKLKWNQITDDNVSHRKLHNNIQDINFDLSMSGEPSCSVLKKELQTNFKQFIPNNSTLTNPYKFMKESSKSSCSNLCSDKYSETSASVMVLPTVADEVIFLDDTSNLSSIATDDKTDNILNIDTMEFLKVIRSGCGNNTERKLKKFEEFW